MSSPALVFDLPPVMGSMLELRQDGRVRRIYLSGDTLMHADLHQIPLRFPDIDLALSTWSEHRSSASSSRGTASRAPRHSASTTPTRPGRYEEYTVMRSPLSDFEEAVARRRLRTIVHRLERGDTFRFDLAGGA